MIFGTSNILKKFENKSLTYAKDFIDRARGGHSHIMELLMLVNQPQKWTLNSVIGKG